MKTRRITPLADRFWKYVVKTDGCWIWTGNKHQYGYGMIGLGRRGEGQELAHRVSWELAFGELKTGEYVLHHCDVPACVRPEHLFKGTHADNMADRQRKGRQPWGEGHGQAKLTLAQVSDIRERLAGGEKGAALAREYGVSAMQISRIKNNKRWVRQ